jgi:hypothetical protein
VSKCEHCGGDTIRFRGTGLDTESWLCPRWRDPGHLSEAEIRARKRQEMAGLYPSSGRFA